MSHVPGCDGSAFSKSGTESAQNRASGMPGMAATASSAAVNGVRGGNLDCCAAGLGAATGGLVAVFLTRAPTGWCTLCARAVAKGPWGTNENVAASTMAAAQVEIVQRTEG